MDEQGVVYLGDGLYVSYDGYQFKLMANSHSMPTDVVYLDHYTVNAFVSFVKRVMMISTEEKEKQDGHNLV